MATLWDKYISPITGQTVTGYITIRAPRQRVMSADTLANVPGKVYLSGGAFEVEDLPEGPYVVTFHLSGQQGGKGQVTITVPEGRSRLATLVLAGSVAPPDPTWKDVADNTYAPRWQANTAYASNAPVFLPNGKTATRTAAGTSRATFDATEAALWTATGGGMDKAEADTFYVDKTDVATPETESFAALHDFQHLFRRPISAADPTFGIDRTGATNTTGAFQAMLDESNAEGKAVEIPRGDYLVSRIIIPPIWCQGHGLGGFAATASQGATIIRQVAGATGGMIRFTANVADDFQNIGPLNFGNMVLRGSGSNPTGKAIEFLATDGSLAGIQDTTILHNLLIRGFVGGGISVPKGARPLHLKDINLLFNGGYGIDFQSPGGYLTQAVHLDNISGDGNLNGLIRIKDMDEAGSIIFTNIKSEKRENSGLSGNPAGQQSVIIFENCADTPVSIHGLTHVSSVPSGTTHEPPGPAFVIRGTGSPKLEWSAVSVRVRPDDVAGTPALLRDEVRGVTVGVDQTSGRYNAGRGLWNYDERSNGGADLLDVGEETFPRRNIASGGVGSSSGALRMTYFTARKTEAVANVRVSSGTTAAAATPTLCRIGIYEVAANGDLTLVGSTANDTALFAAANTRYTKALSASFTKRRGRRYALAILVVSGAAVPNFPGVASIHADEAAAEPRLSGSVGGQTDLPSTVLAASVTASSAQIYAVLTP